jgi:hypothetical protein
MGSQLQTPSREAAIWARLMQARKDEITPQVAEYLLSITFAESDRQRIWNNWRRVRKPAV